MGDGRTTGQQVQRPLAAKSPSSPASFDRFYGPLMAMTLISIAPLGALFRASQRLVRAALATTASVTALRRPPVRPRFPPVAWPS